jgi:hypothetical protein
VEQNGRPGYESTQLFPHVFLTKAPKTYDREKTPFSANVGGKSGYLFSKN